MAPRNMDWLSLLAVLLYVLTECGYIALDWLDIKRSDWPYGNEINLISAVLVVVDCCIYWWLYESGLEPYVRRIEGRRGVVLGRLAEIFALLGAIGYCIAAGVSYFPASTRHWVSLHHFATARAIEIVSQLLFAVSSCLYIIEDRQSWEVTVADLAEHNRKLQQRQHQSRQPLVEESRLKVDADNPQSELQPPVVQPDEPRGFRNGRHGSDANEQSLSYWAYATRDGYFWGELLNVLASWLYLLAPILSLWSATCMIKRKDLLSSPIYNSVRQIAYHGDLLYLLNAVVLIITWSNRNLSIHLDRLGYEALDPDATQESDGEEHDYSAD